MTRMIRGSVLLAACVGLWSCSSDPLGNEAGVPYQVVSSPSVVFVKMDSTELVLAQLLDELGGQIPSDWTISSGSGRFAVSMDSSFRPIYNPDGSLTIPGEQTEIRVRISGLSLGPDTFTIAASGKSISIPVNVVPGTLYATFSPVNPGPGDTVTMTMPPELRLHDSSAVTFTGNQVPIITSRAADGSSISFIPAPTTTTVATVTRIRNLQYPGAQPSITLNTQDTLTTTVASLWTGFLPATFSSLTPSGPPITMTADPAFGFQPGLTITFPLQTAPIINSLSADSSVVTLTVGPNVDQKPQVSRVFFRGAPQFIYTLDGEDKIVSPVIANFPATLSSTNPMVGDTIVITPGAGFTFDPTATVSWSSGAAIVTSSSANQISVLPQPGSFGVPTVSKVISATFPLFAINIPATLPTGLTMQNLSIYGGRGTQSTATTIAVPPLGTDTTEFFDLVQDVNQFYKFTVPTSDSLNIRIDWPGSADIDALDRSGATCNAWWPSSSVQPGATGAHPENYRKFYNVAAPGPSYCLWLNIYDGAPPAWYRVRIIRVF